MAADINNLQDAIKALEAKVGIDSSAVSSSHDYKFSHLITSGAIMLFGENSARTGWTRKSDWADTAMLCYASSGNIGSGGSGNPQSHHTHSFSDTSTGSGSVDYGSSSGNSPPDARDVAPANHTHDVSGTTRSNTAPKYQEVIACQKD